MSLTQTSTPGRSPPILTPPTSTVMPTPVALPLLPALKQKAAAAAAAAAASGGVGVGGGAKTRYERMGRQHENTKIAPRHHGGTTLLFNVQDPKGNLDSAYNTIGNGNTVSLCDSEEMRLLNSMGGGYDRGFKEAPPTTSSQTMTPMGRGTITTMASSSRAHSLAQLVSSEGVRKGAINVSNEHSSQCTDISKRNDHQRHRRNGPSHEFDPSTYTALLPATVRLQKVGEIQSKVVTGTTAKEFLAERGVMKSDRNSLINGNKRVQGVPMLELRQFETRMKVLKERGRNVRRRWKRQTSIRASGNNRNVRIVDEDDESSSESVEGSESSTDSSSAASREEEQLKKRKENVAAAAARRERIKLLQLSGDNASDRVLLRKELRKSRMEVEKARNGIMTPMLLTQQQEENLLQDNEDREDNNESKSKETHLHMEDVSWGVENSILPNRTPTLSFPNDTATYQTSEKRMSRTSTSQSENRRVSVLFQDLLRRARGTMVYGLCPADMQRERRRRRRRRETSALLCISPSPSPPPPINNSEHATPFSSQPRSAHQRTDKKLRLGDDEGSQRRHRPLPVEYGVGERSRQLYDTQVQEQRIEDLQMELEHGEDILRTRELLSVLLPERIKLLDESFGQRHEHANVVLQRHRDKLFKMAANVQAEERQEACLALVNLLEESYRGEIAETAWPSVMNALNKTRELILISPNRCNIRSFQSIIKEYFLMPHLLEPGVDDMLRRLSQLFDLTKSQYRYVMTNIYQRLNQPRNYQSRFREIERTILGKGETSEKRYRVVLHRCRFLLPFTNMGPVVPTTTTTNSSGPSLTSAPSDFAGSVTVLNASATAAGVNVNINIGSSDAQGTVVSGGEMMRRDRGGERFKITVQLKSDHQSFLSRAVSARTKDSAGMIYMNDKNSSGDHVPFYTANLRRQAFRLQLYDNSLLEVAVLRNGLVIASGELKMIDCTLDARGTALLWLRLTSGSCLQAEIKLGLEVLYEKERGRRMTKNDLYK
ncbi:uncharacterized protein TM35_000361680 [Trypanosoma theileri]|uniref:Uncharacterized protein n=1 Tax=Trypanosoma theileri TaxID=67003 RepID=A0A1X0NLA4_9TRYP|nr:uncharacterized protein TM35_000361680 [Trypanosoma theileri]ORC85308.1 hypothetical protein TM35_000361680 [Trypanosoma theileri]